jgi:hypothetical protein
MIEEEKDDYVMSVRKCFFNSLSYYLKDIDKYIKDMKG